MTISKQKRRRSPRHSTCPAFLSECRHGFARIELQRAACVRAFLGDPLLVILEDPTYAAHANLLKPLVDAIRVNPQSRGGGHVVLTRRGNLARPIHSRDPSLPHGRQRADGGREPLMAEQLDPA